MLLLARTMPAAVIEHAMNWALATGDFDPEHVTITARTQHSASDRRGAGEIQVALPTDIKERFGPLPARSTPSLADYDRLLTTTGETR